MMNNSTNKLKYIRIIYYSKTILSNVIANFMLNFRGKCNYDKNYTNEIFPSTVTSIN